MLYVFFPIYYLNFAENITIVKWNKIKLSDFILRISISYFTNFISDFCLFLNLFAYAAKIHISFINKIKKLWEGLK